MSEKYSYLKPYLKNIINSQDEVERNSFYPIYQKEIDEYEVKLGFSFPPQLKEFWLVIGYGFLTMPHDKPFNYISRSVNRINSPDMIGDIILDGVDSEMITQDAFDDIPSGYIPFFEIAASSDFLFLRPYSEKPNAVWDGCGIKIEDSLERFIWRLYYESPEYSNDTVLKEFESRLK